VDIARWREVITQWMLANPSLPDMSSLLIGAVRERPRINPESAAIQEAPARADHQNTEEGKPVKGGPNIAD
jgi:hypothetical protein